MKIGIIGAGNMGGSIAVGLASCGVVTARDIVLCDPNEQTLMCLHDQYPDMTVSTDNAAAVDGTDIIFVVVKPWLIDEVMKPLLDKIDFKRQALVSVVAGVTLEHLAEYAGADSRHAALFRMIPNLAIAYRQSMSFVAQRCADEQRVAAVCDLLRAVGEVMVVEERQMGACTALSSCGIAYVMRYIRAACEGGVELGLYPNQARTIMLQTMAGAVALLNATGSHPEVEIDRVTTPGGITIKGLNAMEANGFTRAVIEGLKASAK